MTPPVHVIFTLRSFWILPTAEEIDLLIRMFVSLSKGRAKEPCCVHLNLRKIIVINSVCWAGPMNFKFQFNPKRFKIVSETGAANKEMSHTCNILSTNETNGTVCILEPWYASVETKIVNKPHLNVQTNDQVWKLIR